MEVFILLALGLITGTLSALFGIGGGVVIVPCMLYLHYLAPSMDFSSHDAVGISIMQMIFSSVFGSCVNIFKKKNLDLKEALFLGAGGLLGAAFSGILVSGLSSKTLLLIFLLVSCYTFYKFLRSSKPSPRASSLALGSKKYGFLFFVGSLTGLFAISLGIGGGVIMTPLLAYYLGFETKKVVPLSLFFIALASISGTTSFVTAGIVTDEVFRAGLTLGIASLGGVLIGSRLIEIISSTMHRRVLLGIYAVSILATLNKFLTT